MQCCERFVFAPLTPSHVFSRVPDKRADRLPVGVDGQTKPGRRLCSEPNTVCFRLPNSAADTASTRRRSHVRTVPSADAPGRPHSAGPSMAPSARQPRVKHGPTLAAACICDWRQKRRRDSVGWRAGSANWWPPEPAATGGGMSARCVRHRRAAVAAASRSSSRRRFRWAPRDRADRSRPHPTPAG